MVGPLVSLASIPFVSAASGWGTNAIAVKMIFRPRRPVRVLGVTFHGLVPKRQTELAKRIAEVIEQELISHADIQAAVSTPEFQSELNIILEREIGNFIDSFMQQNPLLSMFMSEELLSGIRSGVCGHLQQSIPHLLEAMLHRLESRLDFQSVVREKIEQFDVSKLEDIIYLISSRELKAIEYLGGVLGFVIGLAQVGLLVMTQ